MVTRSKKRKLDDDPTKSDSEDETYGEVKKTPRAKRTKPVRGGPAKKKPKKQRYRDSDDDITSDESEESLSEPFEIPEEVEVDERTGRPKRTSTKKPIHYQESDDEDDDQEAVQEPAQVEEHDDENGNDDEDVQPLGARRGRNQILRLKVKPPPPAPAATTTTTRNTRAGSAARTRRGFSNEPTSAGIRRSSRLHHDDQEPIVALTDSGRHAAIVRPGTRSRSPEAARPRRATRGGKGLPDPNVSAIEEEQPGEGEEAHDEDAAHDEPDVPAPTVPRTQPGSRQRSSPSNPEKILSVEDSDPDRLQGMMEQTDAAKSTHAPVDVSPVDAGDAMEGVEQTEVVEVVADQPENEDEDDGPIVRTRRTTRQV